uniref:centrosomal protein of 295 kDa-like n=1 Tax=Halichoerus grypus TaxID=9711 RepID=UPI001659A189|nr:centrosomal protein of 295 kDa-like [Halichoerus grypus]
MTEVTGAWRWLPRRRINGCWEAGGPRALGPSLSELQFLIPGPWFSETLYLKYPEMKRKVVNAGKLRLSPNEEAYILKEDYERRRKLRLLQVREQERGIALQIREDIKQRRNQQLTRLAEELRTEWKESQTQKIKNLEKLYLASLRSMGEGHQQAKENEPDLNALARRAAERRRKAEMRHKEALKLQKNKKEELVKQKTWHITARKEALLVEKERSAKITSLPPPPPTLFEQIPFSEMPALIGMACVGTTSPEALAFALAIFIILAPLFLILISYGYITQAVFRIKSAAGREKAFNTCSSHLIVVCLFYGTIISMYPQPAHTYSQDQGKFLTLFYAIVTPSVNPLIYTLRNKDVKGAIKKVLGKGSTEG